MTSTGFAWGEWFMSPGFGGLAAVVAASIAYIGATRTLRQQREAARKQQWWDRARWALDLTQDEENPTARVVGLEVLDALADSEYAAEHEAEVIQAAVLPILDAYGDEQGLGDLDDEASTDEVGPAEAGRAHLSHRDDEGET